MFGCTADTCENEKPVCVKDTQRGLREKMVLLLIPSCFNTSTSAVQDNALNLSILLSAGKENNSDFLSNGE